MLDMYIYICNIYLNDLNTVVKYVSYVLPYYKKKYKVQLLLLLFVKQLCTRHLFYKSLKIIAFRVIKCKTTLKNLVKMM